VIVDDGTRDPGEVLFELKAAGDGGVVEVLGQVEREEEGEERDDERADVVRLCAFAFGDEGEKQRAHERREEDDRQDGVVEVHQIPVSPVVVLTADPCGMTSKKLMREENDGDDGGGAKG